MIWEEYLKKLITELSKYLKNDIQYSDLSNDRICQIAQREIELFIEDFKKWPTKKLILKEQEKISKKDQDMLKYFITKRKRAVPLAYIIGRQEFYGLSFKLDKNTLIPRPETEELVKFVLNFLSKLQIFRNHPLVLIDVGTGSGCVVVSVIKNIPKGLSVHKVFATDTNKKAIKLAKINANANLGKDNKIIFIKSSLLSFLGNKKLPRNAILIVMANLPYLSEKEYTNLSREVKHYEPKYALMGGAKGHENICKMLDQLLNLNNQSEVFLEISPTVYPAIKKYCASNKKISHIKVKRDLNRKLRYVHISMKCEC